MRVTVSDVILGWGRSSTVRLGKYAADEDGVERPCAVKLLHPSWCYEHKERVAREIAHSIELSTFCHPYIVSTLGVELMPGGLSMVMEFKEGVQTLDRLQESHGGRLPQSVARTLFQQLMLALEFCHLRGLSNRDCKITDLLVHVDPGSGDATLQLTDFSFAKDSDKDADSNPMAQHGSVLFAAPEVITASSAARYSGCSADVWSAGVVLCTLLFGCHPHLGQEDLDQAPGDQILVIMTNAARGAIMVPPEEAAAQPEAFALMVSMLQVDPSRRPTASQVLSHPWMRAGLAGELGQLNAALLADTRLAAESEARGRAVRERVTALLDSLLGSRPGGSAPGARQGARG